MTLLHPDQFYTGPIDADLSDHPDAFAALTACLTFATEAQTNTREQMRERWPGYRGLVPGNVAKSIIDSIEGATCSTL